ncbi:poly(ethylene terephthalate) hydrolase family protein [Parapedobacter koreensis]|uniref:Chlorophyllase enzyme n=1 Tax=Parapedobacter koreensis TaxID=332977 RepID=A0A1H7QY52_9SPHI|nr:hypothetical protein [Parapedobacter koreensis]SEL52575.1 hypothetical protein SAMN05421740_106161 [Parapedobacter koreensis]
MEDHVKSRWERIQKGWRKAVMAITPSRRVLQASGIGIFIVSLLFIAFNFADRLLSSVGIGYYLLTVIGYVGAAYLVAVLISFAIGLAGKTPRYFRQSIAFVIFFMLFFSRLGWPYNWIIIGSLIVFSALIFGGIAYRRKKRGPATVAFLIGIIGLGLGLFFFWHPGGKVPPLTNHKMLADLPEHIAAPDPTQKGKWKVSFLTYGSGKDKHRTAYGSDVSIETPSVDASFLLKPWKGISGKLRTWYFGFDETALPLNAMVWYPDDLEEPAPLVLVVHGNHLAQDWSEGGYDYLGELLASRGYIVASVDENFLNSSFTDMPQGRMQQENGTRGWLMLKHLELWRQWNQDPSSPFYQRVDMGNIALIGHSRGGEAIAHAALFNTLPCFPDNANETFDFNFSINAYVAIAPVDGQYKPASILAPMRDINYFVIHGTHDMDVQSYSGLSLYKRIQYSPAYTGFKAGLYVHHANHGQFNTSWGKYDGSSPSINQFNIASIMPANEQEQIAKVYISAFLETHLKQVTDYKPLFVDYRYGRNWLPKQIYFNQYESSEATFFARYEEDLDLQTASAPGVRIEAENLSVWKESQHNLAGSGHLSRAAYLGWNWEKDEKLIGKYTVDFGDSIQFDLKGKALVFSLAASDGSSQHVEKGKKDKQAKKEKQHSSADTKKRGQDAAEPQPIDFTIALIDREGNRMHVLLSNCSPLQPQLKKKLTKFAFLNTNDDAEPVPDFFYFDLDRLHREHPTFDQKNVRALSFIFDQSPAGVLILDDIGFMKL